MKIMNFDLTALSPALSMHPAPIDPDSARRFMEEQFAVKGRIRPLRSERDENFLVESDTARFVLKFANPAEAAPITHFQTNAMLHLAQAAPELPIPRIVQTSAGKGFAELVAPDGSVRIVRLLTFLPGIMVAEVKPTPKLRAQMGTMLARIDTGLSGFSDPSPLHDLSWDMERAGQLRPLIGNVAEKANRVLAERALDDFEAFAEPAFPQLRTQVIHNDLNPFNVLVDEAAHERIVGILDFGDIVRAPLVHDIAIAASYHVGAASNPLQPVAEMLGGYRTILPLEPLELELLPDLIATRLAMTVLITEWRAAHFPENKPYILKNHPAAVAGLTRLAQLSRDEARKFLGGGA
ncbi:MAG TPA: phosphotransferase [Rhizomicrobium sp.]|jgi:Ser/Thr protein kinase RdoA (MazF antagonist)